MKKKKSLFFTTVTPLSKVLAMILFISLPFIGFYAGLSFNKSSSQIPPVVWNHYVDPDGYFSFDYPSNWRLEMTGHAQDDPNTSDEFKQKKDIELSSVEGEFSLRWVENYGGMCGDEGYEEIKLKNEILPVCHQSYPNYENWWQISRRFSENKSLGFQIDTSVDAPIEKNRAVVLRMLSSFDIHKK